MAISEISNWQSGNRSRIGNQQSAIGNRQSAIGDREIGNRDIRNRETDCRKTVMADRNRVSPERVRPSEGKVLAASLVAADVGLQWRILSLCAAGVDLTMCLVRICTDSLIADSRFPKLPIADYRLPFRWRGASLLFFALTTTVACSSPAPTAPTNNVRAVLEVAVDGISGAPVMSGFAYNFSLRVANIGGAGAIMNVVTYSMIDAGTVFRSFPYPAADVGFYPTYLEPNGGDTIGLVVGDTVATDPYATSFSVQITYTDGVGSQTASVSVPVPPLSAPSQTRSRERSQK